MAMILEDQQKQLKLKLSTFVNMAIPDFLFGLPIIKECIDPDNMNIYSNISGNKMDAMSFDIKSVRDGEQDNISAKTGTRYEDNGQKYTEVEIVYEANTLAFGKKSFSINARISYLSKPKFAEEVNEFFVDLRRFLQQEMEIDRMRRDFTDKYTIAAPIDEAYQVE